MTDRLYTLYDAFGEILFETIHAADFADRLSVGLAKPLSQADRNQLWENNREQVQFLPEETINQLTALLAHKQAEATGGGKGKEKAGESEGDAQGEFIDDFEVIATDIINKIVQAGNAGRLEEIAAEHEDDLAGLQDKAPAHYTRVMRRMELRGQDLDRDPG